MVDRVYNYVHDNIDVVWMYGLQKGAEARSWTMGTPFDQAMLMVELLRQDGFTANYQAGQITLTGQQFYDWTGIQNAQAACQLLSSGSIGATINGTTDLTCAYPTLDQRLFDHLQPRLRAGDGRRIELRLRPGL